MFGGLRWDLKQDKGASKRVITALSMRHLGNQRSWKLFIILQLLLVPSAWGVSLDPKTLEYLLSGGPEGTTVIYGGGAEKIYYSQRLKNTLRNTGALGSAFMKNHIRGDTISEGTFIATILRGEKIEQISGIAGIIADKETGSVQS